MVQCSFELEQQWDLSSIVGVDEVGRGCLAGPVVAGAVLFPASVRTNEAALKDLKQVNDSKKIASEKRRAMAEIIKHYALGYSIAEVGPDEIDRVNILQATFMAMRTAVMQLQNQLKCSFDLLLIDGNHSVPGLKFRQQPVIQGDSRSKTIAAASILAKVYRDELMTNLETDFPGYGFAKHKGYGTEVHREAIERLGPCVLHRKTFLGGRERIVDGVQGELLAEKFLQQNRFSILERRWREKMGEIDLVAEDFRGLHFVEVRSRRRKVDAEVAFPRAKVEKLKKLVELYRMTHPESRSKPARIHLFFVAEERVEPLWDVVGLS